MLQKMVTVGLLVVVLVLLTSRSCGANDFSRGQEKAIGKSVMESMRQEYGLSSDSRLTNITFSVLSQVKRDTRSKWAITDWHINAVRSEVPNAFAAPGGYLFATSGLLEMLNDGELTGVMAHEIGHCVYRHSWDRLKIMLPVGWAVGKIDNKYAQLGAALLATALGAHYSREDERQADSYGAMYNPYGLIGALRKLENFARQQASRSSSSSSNNLLNLGFLGAFRSHPATSSRVAAIEAQASGQTPPPIKLAAASGPTPQTTSAVPRVVALEVTSRWAPENLEQIISSLAANYTSIKFVVWGENFERTSRGQDQIHQSGRYDRSQPQTPGLGKMTPPSEIWFIAFSAWDSESQKGAGFGDYKSRVEWGSRTYSAFCEITVSPTRIETGEYQKGGETLKGQASSTERRFYISTPKLPGWHYRENYRLDWQAVQRESVNRAVPQVLSWVAKQNPVDSVASQRLAERQAAEARSTQQQALTSTSDANHNNYLYRRVKPGRNWNYPNVWLVDGSPYWFQVGTEVYISPGEKWEIFKPNGVKLATVAVYMIKYMPSGVKIAYHTTPGLPQDCQAKKAP